MHTLTYTVAHLAEPWRNRVFDFRIFIYLFIYLISTYVSYLSYQDHINIDIDTVTQQSHHHLQRRSRTSGMYVHQTLFWLLCLISSSQPTPPVMWFDGDLSPQRARWGSWIENEHRSNQSINQILYLSLSSSLKPRSYFSQLWWIDRMRYCTYSGVVVVVVVWFLDSTSYIYLKTNKHTHTYRPYVYI